MILAGSVEKFRTQDFVDGTVGMARAVIRFIDAVKLMG